MLAELIEKFADRSELPVDVGEIVEAIKAMGIQDEIFISGQDIDPAKIRGAFCQFTYHKVLYGEPILVTHVVYSQNVPLEWQRVICAKELVHIFDSVAAKTKTEDEIGPLLDKLVGPFSSEGYGFADFQAASDLLALYQSLPLLFPKTALVKAKAAMDCGSLSAADIAKRACMPVEFVGLMLSDRWQEINGLLTRL